MIIALLLACATGAKNPDGTGDTGGACPVLGNGQLDVVELCVSGLCLPQHYPDVAAAFGAGACTTGTNTSTCTWSTGVTWTFTDCDEDGAPDPDESLCAMTQQEIRLADPYAGTTADGLGLGGSRDCWESAMGEPSSTPGTADIWETDDGSVTRTLSVGFSGDGATGVNLDWTVD